MQVLRPSKKTEEQSGKDLLRTEAAALAAVLALLKRQKLSPETVQRTLSLYMRYARNKAFLAGRTALQRELDELVSRAKQLPELPPLQGVALDTQDLDAAATRAGEKYRIAAMVGGVAGALAAILPDIRRIVATENSIAFNAGHAAIVPPKFAAKPSRKALEQAAAGELKQPTIVPPEAASFVVLTWNATFDNTCPVCASMHGKLADADGNFPGGLWPGSVHPNCRCFTSVVMVTE